MDASTHWVHDLDPFLWRITGDIGIRWYGLSYLLGVVLGALLIRRWIRQGRLPMRTEWLWDMCTTIGLAMVIGGRLGYCLFYRPELFVDFSTAPPFWGVLAVHDGGMASHGGMVGLYVGTLLFTRKHGIKLLVLGDCITAVAPIGVIFGRLANFINGELWSRVTDVSWAVHFPEAMHTLDPLVAMSRWQQARAAIPEAAGFLTDRFDAPWLAFAAQLEPGSPSYEAFYRIMTEPRHPSQLYAVVLEGLLPLLIVLPIHARHRRPGLSAVLILWLYAIGRFIDEFWREPDASTLGWMSRGQVLTLAMMAVTAGLTWWVVGRGSRPEQYLMREDETASR